MNALERTDWLEAVGATFPALEFERLAKRLEALDAAGVSGRWEAGVAARDGWRTVGLRFHGANGADFPRWIGPAREAFGGDHPAPDAAPPEGFPWLDLLWSDGAPVHAALLGGETGGRRRVPRAVACAASGRALLTAGPFSTRAFDDAVARAFESFTRLCPAGAAVSESDFLPDGRLRPRPSWSLRLARPTPWPLFLRLDLAAPFAEGSAQTSFLLRDARVRELAFRGETLWAYVSN